MSIPMTLYKPELVMQCEWFMDLFNNGKLPSMETAQKWVNENWLSDASYPVRSAYTKMYGFPLITEDVLRDLIFHIHAQSVGNVPRVLEVCCGSGYLGSLLKKNEINIHCTDTNKWKKDREADQFFQKPYIKIEEIDALEAIEKYKNKTDIVLLSWPEYESDLATRVLEKCIEYNISMIYIGEDWGGCTADDSFFQLVEDKCNDVYICKSYIPFSGIHDNIRLITKKIHY